MDISSITRIMNVSPVIAMSRSVTNTLPVLINLVTNFFIESAFLFLDNTKPKFLVVVTTKPKTHN